MWKYIYLFFDKLEDRIRGRLSRKPILYAFVGGFGIVLFWRGVWHTVDMLMLQYFGIVSIDGMSEPSLLPWWDGPLSLVLGTLLLLLSGIFVSNFIGNEIILSGLRGEKKIADKTEDELEKEMNELEKIERDLKLISKQMRQKSKRKS